MEENSELRKVIPSLARRAIEYYLKEGKYLPLPPGLPSYLISEKRGVFVSLKKKGRLRGCIGTYIPRYENIAQEIIHNAVSAATQDPRFPPLQEEELPFVSVSVDILSYPEEVNSLEELDPKKYGVIVEKGWKRGLLLPDIEGVDTVDEQIRIALAKAGISPQEKFTIYRFTVDRYEEED
ncbi:MAG TPA: AmmeMemoRadiSam system protein A [Candidatus Atribacteria bacterium]|jgi:AmmeMemoRadiSam system protein A|nr:AmmeMemoRadiSam system protein A [Atribacterota bacterium]HPT62643.1 AmmeMemoRadiSam system protein A [Candidatus Atribacteria bacterium]HPZ39449.1 AmmeMemoRadiSam system protein A [Candidatus Atribacteria bacterium]HQD32584.1 AmmeMemoRadiSam system protein A [Candidatus Atribacteria bacterium]